MAYIQYLKINGENLPLPESYEIELTDVEADTSGETEAGTMQRDIVRSGVVSIPVSFQVSSVWLKKLSGYRKLPKVRVAFFDTESLEVRETEMYLDAFKSSLIKDTSYKGLWNVTFTLREF